MSRFLVAVAVGPGEQEVARAFDLFESVRAHEPRPGLFVMIDDAPEPRRLERQMGASGPLEPLSLHHPRHGRVVRYKRGKGICSAVMLALHDASKRDDVSFVLKLDTDSLVIGPFFEKISRFFEKHPTVGKIGAYTLTPNDTPRDFSRNAENIRSMLRPSFEWRHPRRWWGRWRDPTLCTIRKHIKLALQNEYELGEHCLGGGYAVSAAALKAMRDRQLLDDPALWLPIDCPEDVMCGLYVRAAGLRLANFCAAGEVFGVRHKGLAFPPEQLLERGYSVIHAVKNDPQFPEEQVRAFFRARRSVAC